MSLLDAFSLHGLFCINVSNRFVMNPCRKERMEMELNDPLHDVLSHLSIVSGVQMPS